MPNSNVIFAFMFAAFVIFITMRGKLRKYLGFLLSGPDTSEPVTNAESGLTALPGIGDVLSNINTVLK